jgi:hypothetical protein
VPVVVQPKANIRIAIKTDTKIFLFINILLLLRFDYRDTRNPTSPSCLFKHESTVLPFSVCLRGRIKST